MQQPVMSGAGTSAPSQSAQNWCSIAAGGDGWYTDRKYFEVIAPINCTLSKLYINLTSAPGAGKNYKFDVEVNGSASTLTVTVADAATTGNDSSHSVSITAGDRISLSCTPTGTPASTRTAWGLLVDTAGGGSIIWGGKGDSTDATATEYSSLMGHNGGWSGTENAQEQICSVAGTLQNLRVRCVVAPGVGKSQTFAVRHNGSTTGITLTISGANTTGSDTSNTQAVSAGDRIAIINTHSGSPAASETGWGIELDPTTDGESQIFMGTSGSASAASVNYQQNFAASNPNNGSNANERYAVAPVDFTGKNLYVNLVTAPDNGGGTQSFTYSPTSDSSGTSSSISVVISEAATTGNDTSNTLSYTAGLVTACLKITPSGTPVSATYRFGMTAYIAPAAGGSTFPGYIGGGYF